MPNRLPATIQLGSHFASMKRAKRTVSGIQTAQIRGLLDEAAA
jgi:hypothetical protein